MSGGKYRRKKAKTRKPPITSAVTRQPANPAQPTVSRHDKINRKRRRCTEKFALVVSLVIDTVLLPDNERIDALNFARICKKTYAATENSFSEVLVCKEKYLSPDGRNDVLEEYMKKRPEAIQSVK